MESDDELAMSDPMQGASMGAAFGPWGAAAGGGLGLIKYFAFDKPANDRQRALAAATQKFSPWTHQWQNAPGQVNPIGSTMQGAAAGASVGQSMANAQSNNNLRQAQINYLNSKMGAPGTSTMDPSAGVAAGNAAMAGSPWSQYQQAQLQGLLDYPGVPTQ